MSGWLGLGGSSWNQLLPFWWKTKEIVKADISILTFWNQLFIYLLQLARRDFSFTIFPFFSSRFFCRFFATGLGIEKTFGTFLSAQVVLSGWSKRLKKYSDEKWRRNLRGQLAKNESEKKNKKTYSFKFNLSQVNFCLKFKRENFKERIDFGSFKLHLCWPKFVKKTC